AGRGTGQLGDLVPVEDGEVLLVHGDRHARLEMEARNADDVIDVPMRDQDPIDLEVVGADLLLDPFDLQPGVNYERRRGIAPPDQEAVFAKQLIGEDGDVELLPQGLGRRHSIDTSREAGVSTSGSFSVTST